MPHHIAGRGIANPSLGERAKEPKEGEYNRNRLIWLSVLPKGAQEPLQHPETDPKERSFKGKTKPKWSGNEMVQQARTGTALRHRGSLSLLAPHAASVV